MALSSLFKNIAAAVREHVSDTYALLDLTSAVNEVAVQYGEDMYSQGYTAGRDAEAARHPEPLAEWEKELLSAELSLSFTPEEFVILHRVIGRHTNGGSRHLMPLWGKFDEKAKSNQWLPAYFSVAKVRGGMVSVDNPPE